MSRSQLQPATHPEEPQSSMFTRPGDEARDVDVEDRGNQALDDPSEVVVSDDPNDPLNLPLWRKTTILCTITLASFVGNYVAAAHLTAFPEVAQYYGVGIPSAANAIGIGILGLGVGPLFFNPLSRTVGRRPTYILTSGLFFAITFWIAFSRSYHSFAAARFFAGVTASPFQTLGSTTISDIYRKEVRGFAIALWSLGIVAGPLIAPFIGGLVMLRQKWQWLYYITIIMAGTCFISFLVLVPETLYTRHVVSTQQLKAKAEVGYIEDANSKATAGGGVSSISSSPTSADAGATAHDQEDPEKGAEGKEAGETEEAKALTIGKLGPTWMPWSRPGVFAYMIVRPLEMSKYLPILLPSIYYALVFGWSVGLTVTVPQVFAKPPYGFKPSIIGTSFLAMFIGAVIGKFGGGIVGDRTVTFLQCRNGGVREPEFRLWAMVPPLILLPLGLLLYGIGINDQKPWPMPLVGTGIYYCGVTAATGLIQTYIVDSFVSESMNGIATFNLYKCVFAFAVPFFVPEWALAKPGDATKSYITQAMLALGLGILLTFGFILWGAKLRRLQRMPTHHR